MARVIQSPGVEINEIDLSTRTTFPAGTNILIQGFSQNGPTDEVLMVTTFQEFETIYGAPTNAAERYFYHTVKSTFNSPANIMVARLPYGEKRGETFSDELYSALLFPVSGDAADCNPTPTDGCGLSGCDNIQFGSPERVDLLPEEFFALSNGEVTFENDVLVTLKPGNFDAAGAGTILAYNASQPDAMKLDPVNCPIYYDASKAGTSGYDDLYSTIDGPLEDGVSKRKLSVFKKRLAGTGMVLVNKAQTTINNYFEGYYIGVGDNMQYAVNDGADDENRDFNAVKGLKTFGNSGSYFEVPEARMNFATTADVVTGKDGSISEVFENIPSWDIAVDEHKETVGLAVFKLRKSIYAVDTTMLDFTLDEAMVGSLDAYRTQANIQGGRAKSFYLESAATSSPLLQIFINKNISENRGTFLNDPNDPQVPTVGVTFHDAAQNNAWAIGTYQEEVPASSKKCIGSVPAKVERYFEKLQSLDEWEIDVTLDAGLSTIHTQQQFEKVNTDISGDYCGAYDDEKTIDLSGLAGSSTSDPMTIALGGIGNANGDDFAAGTWDGATVVTHWKAVVNSFVAFAQDRRRDHITVLDPLRHIFVQGKTGLTVKDNTKNWSQHIYYPLKHLYSTTNTNYACTYGNWFLQYDKVVDKNVWVPPSGVIGAAFANNDATYQPWFAPAGFTRGLLSNVLEAAIRPNQKQRDQFYKIGLNPIAFFPADGYVIFGQKTLQAKPSAFDRINVRRMFLWAEKAVRRTVKYYVFEPNTARTRASILAVLEPIFQRIKNTEGLYDFLLVCDDRNNSPTVIDNNELVVDIYLKPVRAAEFILVNFYATRTDQNFSELVG